MCVCIKTTKSPSFFFFCLILNVADAIIGIFIWLYRYAHMFITITIVNKLKYFDLYIYIYEYVSLTIRPCDWFHVAYSTFMKTNFNAFVAHMLQVTNTNNMKKTIAKIIFWAANCIIDHYSLCLNHIWSFSSFFDKRTKFNLLQRSLIFANVFQKKFGSKFEFQFWTITKKVTTSKILHSYRATIVLTTSKLIDHILCMSVECGRALISNPPKIFSNEHHSVHIPSSQIQLQHHAVYAKWNSHSNTIWQLTFLHKHAHTHTYISTLHTRIARQRNQKKKKKKMDILSGINNRH